ncbi:hypothetical protein BJ742DRAFT_830563 [Cladochytrium replicatum]|nr:hypothetical protein BJ742DRAFT_830563 [Cladochytrium replicatum]
MELPHLGRHCKTCNTLDYLPITCPFCADTFCQSHATAHPNCTGRQSYETPLCPLCSKPVPLLRSRKTDDLVNDSVEAHIAAGACEKKRPESTIRTNRCEVCKKNELVPVVCRDCGMRTCLRHRFPSDHRCAGASAAAAAAAGARRRLQPIPAMPKTISVKS